MVFAAFFFCGEFSPFGDFFNSLKNHNPTIFSKNRNKISKFAMSLHIVQASSQDIKGF
jgi:hypothetical protein